MVGKEALVLDALDYYCLCIKSAPLIGGGEIWSVAWYGMAWHIYRFWNDK